MNRIAWFAGLTLLVIAGSAATAQQQPTPEMLKAKEFFSTAGIPGHRWIEGETMVPHVAPAGQARSGVIVTAITQTHPLSSRAPYDQQTTLHATDLLVVAWRRQ